MTTIISRLYDSAATAEAVAADLEAAGFGRDSFDVISQTGAASVSDRLAEARVDGDSAQAYAQHLSAERAVVVVRAGFNPIGSALKAMQIVNGHGPLEVGAPHPDRYVRVKPRRDLRLSILTSHRRFLSDDMTPGVRKRGPVTAAFGFPMLRAKRGSNSALSGTRFFSGGFFPWGLLMRKDQTNSATRGGGHPFSSFFNMPLLSAKPRYR